MHRIFHVAKEHAHKHAKRVAHHVVKHYPKAIALLLFIAMGYSEVLWVSPVHAATYTTTWTTQGDFESNTAGNGGNISTTTSQTRLDLTTTPDTILMGPGSENATSTSFTDSYQIDTANSTAIASGGNLVKTNVDTVTDLTSNISSFWGTRPINNMAYMSSNSAVYFTGSLTNSTSVFIGKYSASDSRNLSSKFGMSSNGNGGNIQIAALQSAGEIYVTDNNGACNPDFYKHSIANDSNGTNATNLSSKLAGLGSGGCYVGHYGITAINDSTIGVSFTQNTIYDYSPTTGNVTTYSITNSGSATAGYDNDLIYASTANALITAGDPYIGKYNVGGGTSVSTDISSINPYGGLGYATIDETTGALGTVYFGGSTYNPGYMGTFGKYNISTNVITDLSSYANSAFGIVTGAPGGNGSMGAAPGIRALVSYSSTELYMGGQSDNGTTFKLIKYNPSTNAVDADLTSSLPSGFGTSTAMAVGNGVIYIGSSLGKLVKLTAPPATQTAQSNAIDTIDGNIAYATLTKNDTLGTGTVTYYLSNDGTNFYEVTPGSQYNFSAAGSSLKWKIQLTGNATVQDISISYNGYSTSILGNIKKDAGGDAIMTTLAWNVSLPANTAISFRTRGATQAEGAAALYSASWSDYTVSADGAGSASIKTNGNGATNPTYRYLEIEATLTSSNGVATPYISDFTLTYVINGPPDFDTTYGGVGTGATTTVSTAEGADWGKIITSYSIRDADGSSGSATPNLVTPSFEYSLNGGSSWTAVNSSYLGASDVSNKTVADSAYNTYSSTWNAVGQLGTNTYTANAKIRVTINDNEPVNNTATAASAAFALDTKSPSVSSFHIDNTSSTSTLAIVATDDTTIKEYKLSNNSSGAADGVNATSGEWQTVGAATLSLNTLWTFASSSASMDVTFVIRDIYGNTATTTTHGPVAPASMEIKDISSSVNSEYREFVTWTPFTAATGVVFSKYQLFRSTDDISYSLLSDITSSATNYYTDNSVATTSTYYYKVRSIDSDSDFSAYSSVVNDLPDGQGGSDIVAPTLTNVAVGSLGNTSAQVTWDTDELSTSVVEYGLTSAYGSAATSTSYLMTGHTISLTSLAPGTLYYYRAKSTDISSNIGYSSSGTFTTGSGPLISSVTAVSITDKQATIQWTTNTAADSYVNYSVSSNLGSYTTAGNATLVSGQHQVTITGLTASRTYYYQVKSTDESANMTTDNNLGSYYSFTTTADTTAPVISNITVPVKSDTSAVVVWTTDELANSQAEFGTTASTTAGNYASTTALDSTQTINHTVALSGLTAATRYFYRVRSIDSASNAVVSDENEFTSADAGTVTVVTVGGGGGGGGITNNKDLVPPVISSITMSGIVSFGAKLVLTATEPVYVLVNYGETASYGQTAASTATAQSHTVPLAGLKPGTTYYYQATVIDSSGNTAVSQQGTFKTLFLAESLQDLTLLKNAEEYQARLQDIIESALPSILPPFIDSPTVSSTTEDAATITYKTSIKSFGIVSYSTDDMFKETQTYGTDIAVDKEKTTSHTVTLADLTPNTKYHFLAKAFVFPEVVGKSNDIIFSTKAAQVAATIMNVTTDSFRAVWKSIVPATSVIKYTNTATGITQEKTSSKLETEHDMTVEGLSPRTTYVVNISGATAGGNEINAKETFTVKTIVDLAAPTINELKISSALTAGQTNSVQTIVSWKTDELSTSNVSYEEGSGAPNAVLANKASDTQGLVQNHIVILTNLKQATIYRVQIASTDAAGNTAAIPITTIITPKQNESIVDVIFKNFGTTFSFIKSR